MAKKQKCVVEIPHGRVVIISHEDENSNSMFIDDTLQKRINFINDALK